MDRRFRYARISSAADMSSTTQRTLPLPQRTPLRKLIFDFVAVVGAGAASIPLAPFNWLTRLTFRAGNTPIIDLPGFSAYAHLCMLNLDVLPHKALVAGLTLTGQLIFDFGRNFAVDPGKYSQLVVEMTFGAATRLSDKAVTAASTYIDIYGEEQDEVPLGMPLADGKYQPATRRFLHKQITPAIGENTIQFQERGWYNAITALAYDTEYTVLDAANDNITNVVGTINQAGRQKDEFLNGLFPGLMGIGRTIGGVESLYDSDATYDYMNLNFNGVLFMPFTAGPVDMRAPSSLIDLKMTSGGVLPIHFVEDVIVPEL